MEDLQFPNARAALQAALDGTVHAGARVQARYELQADSYGAPILDGGVQVVVYRTGGKVGYLDRVDELNLETYGPRGELVQAVAESIVSSLEGINRETPEGFLDRVDVVNVPTETPYMGADVALSTASLRVITRPL